MSDVVMLTFKGWQAKCSFLHCSLAEIRFYLNDNGQERMRVFKLLSNLACYFDSAQEMVAWLDDKTNQDEEESKLLASSHARSPINALRNIAKAEAENASTQEEKPAEADIRTFYVTYAFDGRYVAEVHAKDVEEAMLIAQDEWESADFGDAEIVSKKMQSVEDENGNFLWEC